MSRVTSTPTTHGSKFLTPTKKLDCLLACRTIPQTREASPRPCAYIDLTEDQELVNEQPSSTMTEEETLVGIQSGNNEEGCSENEEQPEIQDRQQSQLLPLEPIETEEEPISVVEDVLLPPEELQILQETSSPSQIVSEEKKTDEGMEGNIESGNEGQVERGKEVSLGRNSLA